jgi:hypothetical protein
LKGTFIRNGASHTPAEAVAHVKAKYEHFKNQIKTPEEFIRLSAISLNDEANLDVLDRNFAAEQKAISRK